MLVDSHCHLDAAAFDGDRDAVLARAAARGVGDLVVPAVGAASWAAILELASRPGSPRCHAALGLHPVSLADTPASDDAGHLDELATLAARGGIVAIGECGLDAAIDLVASPLERQERVLRAQLALARDLELPVILHARGPAAYRRLAEVLAEASLAAGGVLHSYGGGADLLRHPALAALHLGFAGPATYPDARKVRASVRAAAPDRLLAETDAPDQCPVPYRPGRSEPAYVVEVIAGIAAARGEPADVVAARASDNARRLFGLA